MLDTASRDRVILDLGFPFYTVEGNTLPYENRTE